MKLVLPLLLLLLAPAAHAQAPGGPIPQEPDSDPPPEFVGKPATPKPVYAPAVPAHPHMAPNGRSNIHSDAFMTDTNVWSGPLGVETETTSTFQSSDCASVTFDSKGRIVTICVGAQRPRLKLFDPRTLEELATMDLPPREPSPGGNIFQDFAGGGYFYLDGRDRSILPTTNRHLYVVSHASGSFVIEQDIDLNGIVSAPDKIISALPDWNGLVWFASTGGVVGTVELATGRVMATELGEENQNSFTVGDGAEVYVVTEKALYRMLADATGTPSVRWRKEYPNAGVRKPGQASAGSGTTPTVMGRWVAITDNADPMNVVVYERGGGAEICRQPVFQQGAGATDNSLIGAGHSIVVENNYGYEGPDSTLQGARTTPGVERIDIDRDGRGCRRAWHSDETSPTVVPKLSLRNGLVYVYTQGEAGDSDDPWYLTAIDFRTGKTVWKRLTGQGFGFNNNYAPVTIGPDGTAYVGVLGGLTLVRDKTPPPQRGSTTSRIRLRVSPRRVRAGRRVRLRFRADAPLGGVRAPVAGASVRLGGRTVTTGARGRARMKVRVRRGRTAYATKLRYREGRVRIRVRRP
jgi:hypothetical protein